MATLLETLQGTVLDTAVTSALQTSLAELPGQIPAVPAQSIQQATSLISQVRLPDLQVLAGEGADRLTALVSNSLNNPDALWSALSNPLTELEQSLSTRLQQPIDTIFQQIRDTNSLVPASPATLLEPISAPLRQAANLLVENPEIQHIVEFVGKIESLHAQLEAAPNQLAVLLQEQIQAAIQEGTALVSPHLSALDQFIGNLETQAQPATLAEEYEVLSNNSCRTVALQCWMSWQPWILLPSQPSLKSMEG